MKFNVNWLDIPNDSNYIAAESYLSLLFDPVQVESIIDNLKKSPITKFKPRDIFRASKLPILGISEDQVENNIDNIEDNVKLSSILLIRDPRRRDLIIADGYHRLVTVYGINENELIPCKIISI